MKQIYLIKNIVNDKVYVGQAKSAYQRFRRHRNNLTSTAKIGMKIIEAFREIGADNFYFEILELCEDDKADEREQYYINKYNSFENGYNDTIGGDGNRTITQKILDECDRLFFEGETITNIERLTGVNHHTFVPYLRNKYPDYDEKIEKMRAYMVSLKKSKPVDQYTIDGKYLATYKSAREGAKKYDKSRDGGGIANCCNGKALSCMGFRWTWKGEKLKEIDAKKLRIVKPINVFLKDGTFVGRYESIAETSRQLGVSPTEIESCCKGTRNYKKYTFKYDTN